MYGPEQVHLNLFSFQKKKKINREFKWFSNCELISDDDDGCENSKRLSRCQFIHSKAIWQINFSMLCFKICWKHDDCVWRWMVQRDGENR